MGTERGPSRTPGQDATPASRGGKPPRPRRGHGLLRLQRTAGNRAVSGAVAAVQRDGKDPPGTGGTGGTTTSGGSGGTGTIFLDSSGVGHKAPDPSKAPSTIFLDSSGVGHKAPDPSKAPSTIFLDSSGVGHKAPDKSTTPPVLHMDPKGVGHKAPDSLNKGAESILNAIKVPTEQALLKAAEVKKTGTAWGVALGKAQTQQLAAENARTAGKAVWNVEAAGSGLTAANQAALSDTAAAAAEKEATDAGLLEAAATKQASEVAGRQALNSQNLVRFSKDKANLLKGAGMLTQAAVAEIERLLQAEKNEILATASAWTSAQVALTGIRNAAVAARTAATEAKHPLSMPLASTLYTIVGMMQQKLNQLESTLPALPITALFDDPTEDKLKAFQGQESLPATGMADAATWTKLDTKAPTVVRNGAPVVEDPSRSAAVNPMDPDDVRPKLSLGSRGAGVHELQQRLNNWRSAQVSTGAKSPFDALKPDGIFGLKTRAALLKVQRVAGLPRSASTDKATWAALDAAPGPVTKGERRFDMRQHVEGMLTGLTARFDWEVTDTDVIISVKIKFSGATSHPMLATWLQDIQDVWNAFKAREVGGAGRERNIVFKPLNSSSGKHKVAVRKPTKDNPNPRSDAGNWYVNDTRKGLAPHEFGHLIGLQDEYNRPEEQYVAATGQQATVGALQSGAGNTSTETAKAIHDVIVANAGATGKVMARKIREVVVDNEGMVPGAFSRLVAQRYENNFGFDGAPEMSQYLAQVCQYEWTGDLTAITEPFVISNTSIMGTMESTGDRTTNFATVPDHEHPVQPRHVRYYADLLPLAFPGTTWETTRR